MVFKEGTMGHYKKAKNMGIHIVGVLWIEACQISKCRAPESEYPCMSRERYESPGLFPRIRKLKSMQPNLGKNFFF